MKFFLDENVNKGLYYFIKELGYDVTLCPKGITNGNVFRTCVNEDRILITMYEDFKKNILFSKTFPGIIIKKISPEDLNSQKYILNRILKEFNINKINSNIVELNKDSYKILK